MSQHNRSVKFIAVGDIHPDRSEPETLFDQVGGILKSGDLSFCQLECTMTEKGVLRTDKGNPIHRVSPNNVKALTYAGFTVVSIAGNNAMDYGIDAFLDTKDLLERHGMTVVGGGANLDEARRPVVVDAHGLRFAFISACSILPGGYAATEKRAGIAPLMVKTYYEPIENIYEQPGTPAKTITIVDHDQLGVVLDSIAKAKASAHFVVASFHWGVHWIYDLAMYQPEVAYAAIDAGADLVIGHHPHCLQPIDVYKGKPILYSLGNFAFETTNPIANVSKSLSAYGLVGEKKGTFYHPTHTRQSIILKCEFSERGIEKVSVIPSLFGEDEKPMTPPPTADDFESISTLLADISGELGTVLERDGNELNVRLQKPIAIDARDVMRNRKISYLHLRRLPYQA